MTEQEIRIIVREELRNLIEQYLDMLEEKRMVYDLLTRTDITNEGDIVYD